MKTKPTAASAAEFVDGIENEGRRDDCRALLRLMKKVTKSNPKMWGPSIVGFGNYHYKYESGREGDWFLMGFSPRKQDLTLYLMAGYEPFPALMKELGKYKTGKSCLYLKRLSDVDVGVLEQLMQASMKATRETYG